MDISGKMNKFDRTALQKAILNPDEKKENKQELELEEKGEKEISEFVLQKVDANSLEILSNINKVLVNHIDQKFEKTEDITITKNDKTEEPDENNETEEPEIRPCDVSLISYCLTLKEKGYSLESYTQNDDGTYTVTFVKDNESLTILVEGGVPEMLKAALGVFPQSTEESDEISLEEFLERLDNGEFDKSVYKDEAMEVITQLTDLMTADLKEKYNFSDDFLDKIVDFAKKEIIRECIKAKLNIDYWYSNVKLYEAGDDYWNQYYDNNLNLKDILNSIKSDIEAVTGDAVYWKQRGLDFDENDKAIGWSEDEYHQSENYLLSAFFSISFINSCQYLCGDQPYADSLDDPYCKQNSFLSDLYKEAFYKLGITRLYNSDYDEINEFKSKVLSVIAEKIGVDINEMTPMDIMTKFDTNGNNSWLDELSDCITAVFNDTYIENYQNAATINTDVLLGDNNSIDAKYISDHLVDFKFSNDAGTQKFNDIIHSVLLKFNIYNDYDEIEVINALIKFINNKAGIENTNPPTLSKEAINILNTENIFDVIDNIINDGKFEKEYYYGSIDGEIGTFGQGGTGDCWLLAGLISLNSSQYGRQLIKDSLNVNNDGSVTVTFKGIGKSYPIRNCEAD